MFSQNMACILHNICLYRLPTFRLLMIHSSIPSPIFPACSAAPPCRIFVRTVSPSAGCCAALPIPPGRGAAFEPEKNKEQMILFLDQTQVMNVPYFAEKLNYTNYSELADLFPFTNCSGRNLGCFCRLWCSF